MYPFQIEKSYIIKMYELSLHVFICAFHLGISSLFIPILELKVMLIRGFTINISRSEPRIEPWTPSCVD